MSVTFSGASGEFISSFLDSLLEQVKDFVERGGGQFSIADFREHISLPEAPGSSKRLKMPSNKSKPKQELSDETRCTHTAVRAPHNRCAKKRTSELYCTTHEKQHAGDTKKKDGKLSLDKKGGEESQLTPLPGMKGHLYNATTGCVFTSSNADGKRQLTVHGKLANLENVADDDFVADIAPLSEAEVKKFRTWKVKVADSAIADEASEEEEVDETPPPKRASRIEIPKPPAKN